MVDKMRLRKRLEKRKKVTLVQNMGIVAIGTNVRFTK